MLLINHSQTSQSTKVESHPRKEKSAKKKMKKKTKMTALMIRTIPLIVVSIAASPTTATLPSTTASLNPLISAYMKA